MGLQTYQLVAGDWIGLERILNDLTGRVVGQTMGPTSSPTFAGMTLTGLSGVLQATAGVLSGDADHNSLGNIQGGTTDEYYHLTSAEHSALGGFIAEEVDPVFAAWLATVTPANWNTAYTDRLKWDGGSTDLVVATGRTSLGLGIADTPSFTGVILGIDSATNTAGTLKLWSAGANNYSTLFTVGTQTADATYTLPTAMPPATSQFLQCTTSGVLSWETVSTVTPTIDTVLTAGNTSASNSMVLTAGTVTAEQLTSTDDITGAGTLEITATLGAEKVTNGTFISGTNGWTPTIPGSGYTWSSGYVMKSGDGTTALAQTSAAMQTPLVVGEYYTLTYTVSTWTVGSVTPSCGGVTLVTVSVDGTYTLKFRASNTNALSFAPTNTSRFYISAISLKKTGGQIICNGQILNTMPATGTQGIWCDGETHPFVYAGAEANRIWNKFTRKYTGATTAYALPGGIKLGDRTLAWDADISRPTSGIAGAAMIGGGDSLVFSGDMTLTFKSASSPSSSYLLSNFSQTKFSGTFASTFTTTGGTARTVTMPWYGGYFGCINGGIYNINATQDSMTYKHCFVGGLFSTQDSISNPLIGDAINPPAPSITDPNNLLRFIYCGGLFVGVGTTGGVSTSYGGWFSGTGSDNNYGVWSNAGLNVFAANTRIGGTTDPTVALDVTGQITADNIVTGTYFQTSTAITTNSSGTVAIVAKDTNLLTANAGWMPIKKSDGTVVYVPYWT